jgi:hypothetical protein
LNSSSVCRFPLIRQQYQGPTGFTVNGVSFEPPSVPVLLQILNGTQKASDLLPAGSVYGLEANKSVEINIPAFAIAGPVSRTIPVVPSIVVLILLSVLASYTSPRRK